jgi:predicted helicase
MAADRRRHDSIFKLFSLGVVTNRDDWMYATDDPTLTRRLYFERHLNEMQYQLPSIFVSGKCNPAIIFSSGKRGTFACLATLEIPSLDVFLPDACQVFGLHRIDSSGEAIDTITDALLPVLPADHVQPHQHAH